MAKFTGQTTWVVLSDHETFNQVTGPESGFIVECERTGNGSDLHLTGYDLSVLLSLVPAELRERARIDLSQKVQHTLSDFIFEDDATPVS